MYEGPEVGVLWTPVFSTDKYKALIREVANFYPEKKKEKETDRLWKEGQ